MLAETSRRASLRRSVVLLFLDVKAIFNAYKMRQNEKIKRPISGSSKVLRSEGVACIVVGLCLFWCLEGPTWPRYA